MKKLKSIDCLVTYTAIYPLCTEGGITYRLSANIDEKGNYFMPSLEFQGFSEETVEREGLQTFWDSEVYLIEVVRKNLLNVIEGIGPVDHDELEFINKHIPESDYQAVIDVIDQGIVLGFFKEYYDQVNYPDEQK